jgi:hypothetical protein
VRNPTRLQLPGEASASPGFCVANESNFSERRNRVETGPLPTIGWLMTHQAEATMTAMTMKSEKAKQTEKREPNNLGDQQLDQVSGGFQISPKVDNATPKLLEPSDRR